MSPSQRSTVFLLGSGVSLQAGLLSTEELTESVLFQNDLAPGLDIRSGAAFRQCLCSLRNFVSQYYEVFHLRPVQYEDLYYIVEQIHDEHSGNLDNPLVSAAARELEPVFWKCAHDTNSSNIATTAGRICDFIRTVVAHSLIDIPSPPDYLQFLVDALEAQPAQRLAIMTLNHDLVVEKYLSRSGATITDGFGAAINGLRYFTLDDSRTTPKGFLLLKLHGSIDWYRFRTDDASDWYDERIGRPDAMIDIDHTVDPQGRQQSVLGPRPYMLVGTFNKLPQYSRHIFHELLSACRSELSAADFLVVCGYSFGDQGVNSIITEWVYSSKDHRVLVVHPHPDELRAGARGAIRNKWDQWIDSGALSILSCPAEDLSWENISEWMQE